MSDDFSKAIYEFNDLLDRAYASAERNGLTKADIIKEAKYTIEQWEQDEE